MNSFVNSNSWTFWFLCVTIFLNCTERHAVSLRQMIFLFYLCRRKWNRSASREFIMASNTKRISSIMPLLSIHRHLTTFLRPTCSQCQSNLFLYHSIHLLSTHVTQNSLSPSLSHTQPQRTTALINHAILNILIFSKSHLQPIDCQPM